MGSLAIIAAKVIAVTTTLSLAACSGGGVMTSFDAEKSRIRGALSATVECIETKDNSGGRSLECRSPGQSLRLVLYEYGGPVQGAVRKLDVQMELNDRSMEGVAAAWEFRRVLEAYSFDKDDVVKCIDRKSFDEQGPTFRVMCQMVDGIGAKAVINQTTAV